MEDGLLAKVRDFISHYWLSLLLFLLGLIVLGYGLIVLFRTAEKPQDIVFETLESESSTSAKIMVDISGAVVKPGVYEFSFDSRVKDVLEKAGGLSDTADGTWVAKNINLASKIQDGAKIYIPEKGTTSTTGITGSNTFGSSTSQLISINSGSQAELESLPGVGPVTAGKIISNRPYNDLNELVSKKVIGQSTFEKIKDKIATY